MPEQFEIKRAERRQARLRIAFSGASNGGKTRSSLALAFGILERLVERGEVVPRPHLASPLEGLIGLIDTERRSAQLESHVGPFDTIDLGPPHSVERYVGALAALERAGCAVIILDSISHAWVGDGGVLHVLDSIEAHQRFSAFGTHVNPLQERFVDALLRSPAHIIATMRSKTAWVLEDKERRDGRVVKTPRRIGMAPVQRPGIEFEFTALLDLDTDTHFARVVKSRGTVFERWEPHRISREDGRRLADWLLEGAPEVLPPVSGTPAERLAAVAAASLRLLERQANLPDLAREFEHAKAQLRALTEEAGPDPVREALAALVAAKDARKAALQGLTHPVTVGVDAPAPRRGSFEDMKDDIPW